MSLSFEGDVLRDLAGFFDRTTRRLLLLTKLSKSDYQRLLETIKDPENLRPDKLRGFAERAGVDVSELGFALSTAIGPVSVSEVDKAKDDFRGRLDRLEQRGEVDAEDKASVLKLVEELWQVVGDAHRGASLSRRAIGRTFATLEHMHCAPSVAAVSGAPRFDPRRMTLERYEPDVERLEPVAVIQLDVDAFGEMTRIGFAVGSRELEMMIYRLEAAKKDMEWMTKVVASMPRERAEGRGT